MRLAATLLALTLAATAHAGAGSMQLSVGACPGNPGASTEAMIDCAKGEQMTIYITAIAGNDCAGPEVISYSVGLQFVGTNLPYVPFWNWQAPCDGLPVYSPQLPAGPTCDGYTPVIPPGSYAPPMWTSNLYGTSVDFEAIPARAAITSGEKLYIGTFTLPVPSADCAGCDAAVTLSTGGSLGGNDNVGNMSLLNTGPLLYVNQPWRTQTAVRPMTWGALKSLYR